MTPTAATRVAGVIGHPVAHSISPAIHNAAFAACGLDWVYVALDVAPGHGRDAVDAMRALGLGGLSVTMPHKEDVARALVRLSDDAAALGAVNTIVPGGWELRGENTDGAGFIDSLRLDHGIDPAGWRVVVAGAGGAARAVILALAHAGVAEVAVVNRTVPRAVQAAALAGDRGRALGTNAPGVAAAVTAADLVVNATPVGMEGLGLAAPPPPVDPAWLRAGQVVADLVYRPVETPLLRAAAEQGAHPVDGLGMLVHQAGHQFRLWTGVESPLEIMAEAARASLAVS
ncbi:MAG: shikimate dehydrogenase [Acidimicrobiales bacterium]